MQTPDGRAAGEAVTIPRSIARSVHSRKGREYRLLLAWPPAPPPPGGFPVIYVLDAYALFGTMVESIRMRSRRPDATGVVPAVVAGIGYPGDEQEARARRSYDFTPAVPDSSAGAGGTPASEAGGATEFLEFIDDRLKPEVEQLLPIDSARRTLFGHSLGARFVLQTLLSSPASFDTYVAVSPSIWWARDQLFAAAAAVERDESGPLRERRVMITVGEYEQALAPWQGGSAEGTAAIADRRSERRMVDDARALAMRLEALCAAVRFDVLAGEDHASAVLRSLGDGLRFCAAPAPRPPAGPSA